MVCGVVLSLCVVVCGRLLQVDVVQKMVTALSGGKAKYVKETLAVLTTTEAQKSLIQSLLRETDMDKDTMEAVRSQVMTIRASRGEHTLYTVGIPMCVYERGLCVSLNE